ncbi:MAG: hypothetical protein HGB03_03690 [Candidatus Yonathbacteria bacterium]|nr:hypothetical protein [Candidatus Yonathbacteria bacterium]NTW47665.1 hypothetical protein [Candidatus Yonathbacteria bacterium]
MSIPHTHTFLRTTGGGMLLDVLIVIAVVIALWFAWVAVGGPAQFAASPEGLFLDAPTSETSTNNTGEDAFQNNFWHTEKQTSTQSPLAAYVTMRVNAPGGIADAEYVEIALSSSSPTSMTLTGWTITSSSLHKTFTIGNGISVLHQGISGAPENIVLEPGMHAYIISGRSPVGASFRTNICSGFLSAYQTFTPPLDMSCPPAQALIGRNASPDTACISTIESLPRCSATPRNTTVSASCLATIKERVSYNTCVSMFEKRPDFSGPLWYIYAGSLSSFWWSSDILTLSDDTGQTVASLSF